MKNFEKYKNEDRSKAFYNWCGKRKCGSCDIGINMSDGYVGIAECVLRWLDMEEEDEEQTLPCPYCGGETRVEEYTGADHKPHYRVVCDDCYMQSCAGSRKDVVEKYNLVARAAMKEKEGVEE